MSRELGKDFGHFAESLLPHLILLIPNSVRVMSTSGSTAVRYIIRVSSACSTLSYAFNIHDSCMFIMLILQRQCR